MKEEIEFTIYFKTILFLSIILFLVSYLFENLLASFFAIILLVFLVYTRNLFKPKSKNIEITREILEKQSFVNHPLNVKTRILNKKDTYKITAIDLKPENSEIIKGSNKKQKILKPGGKLTLEYQIILKSRGRNEFKHVKIKISDILKLYEYKTNIELENIINAHSDPVEVQKAKRVSQREHIEITTPSLVGTENVYEMEGIRNYSPGDRLKDIEWKATSRLQKIMTKLFEKKEVIDSYILLECTNSMRRTTKNKSKIDHATNLAVHLTRILQSLRHRVGLLAYDEYKLIKQIKPTNNYNIIFQNLTDLPGQIKTKKTKTKKIQIKENNTLNNQEQQRFISTVFPFLAKGRRKIKNSTQATGIFEAIRYLLMDNNNKHIIIITDMETNIQSLYRSIILAHARKYKIWLLTSYTSFYNIDKKQLSEEEIEKMYKEYNYREKILRKLKRINIEIVELTPDMEGAKIVEKIRRKT